MWKFSLLLVLAACSACERLASKPAKADPKFKLTDIVRYKPDPFYSKVCSGKGIVVNYITETNGSYIYVIQPATDGFKCPDVSRLENEITLVEEESKK